ncbi:MAG: iron-containing alcohol dehydrogenase [Alistipes sp.]|nr:iron-containing alcohol dehydrogenase [Alistipes sp.]
MKLVTLQQPARTVIGCGAMERFAEEFIAHGFRKLFLLTAPPIRPLIAETIEKLEGAGVEITIFDRITAEPALDEVLEIIEMARKAGADSVVGIGGGSVLDTAKVVACFVKSKQQVADCFGTGLIKERGLWCGCLPTTSGTGSEVSPNAILLDRAEKLKKGLVSPYLLCDAAYIDPMLTLTVPAKITAETGMDALTHCIEAYTNRFAHPVVDRYALAGIELIAKYLERAVKDGKDIEAREALSLGSYYGGLCLAPVNTAAVHALSYPLGGEYHISHGLANAILLPTVMRFNMSSDWEKHARIAAAIGVDCTGLTTEEAARKGVEAIAALSARCGIPSTLTELGIGREKVEELADSAMKVTRLLVNNPREVTREDAINIYNELY